mmetsp:Transcript_9922/g.19569  ORF Transcript_9922/g.19569 Transcript_9922/m.19569 type:complete len:330 (-) Transcript_9922:249-1238(-)
MKNRVHVHFIGWDAKWDRIMDISRNQDCFAKPGRYSSVREKSEFKVSDDVLIMRRKPPEARGKWIQGYVRMVDGPQLQVQYTYRGITFQYWYHYQQPEVHPMKDKNRWLGLKPSERMQDLPDGESGLFGKEIVYLLFSRKAPSLKRVGAHADGTCFFHAVFHSLDTKDPRDGKGLSYRNLSSEERAEKGCEWRQALSRQVDRKWFAENLGNVCEYKSYLEQYSTATYSVGPTHNMHVAARFQVNIFFVSFYTNPDTKERDFFVRISSPDGAAQYNKEKPSIILFHRAHGERGHYESVQTDEEGREFGRGIFKHSDSIIQHLLTKANKLM